MMPILWNEDILTSSVVLWHERTHSFLFETYGITYGVPHIMTHEIQEALADFMAAHYQDNPVLWEEGGLFSRDVRQESFHAGIFASILWELRGYVGPEAMGFLLKPFIDNLIQHRESFDEDHPERSDEEYFVFILKWTLRERAESLPPGSEGFVDRIASDLGLWTLE